MNDLKLKVQETVDGVLVMGNTDMRVTRKVTIALSLERDISVGWRCVSMCVVHRCAAICVTFVVTEARHDLHFCHCVVVCTYPSPRK